MFKPDTIATDNERAIIVGIILPNDRRWEVQDNLAELRHNSEKTLHLTWDKDVSGEFTIELRVELEHQRGIIAQLATGITVADASIDKISVDERDGRGRHYFCWKSGACDGLRQPFDWSGAGQSPPAWWVHRGGNDVKLRCAGNSSIPADVRGAWK